MRDENMTMTEAAQKMNMKVKVFKQLLKDIDWLGDDGKTILPEATNNLVEGKKVLKRSSGENETITFPLITVVGWFNVRKEFQRLENLVEEDIE